MRDIPLFTTQNGASSLILREIPYSASAYVRIRAASDAAAFVGECASFCTAAGAKRVYATGCPYLERFPFHTEILRMRRLKAGLPETEAVARPVTEQSLERWRGLYNAKMAGVPNAAYLTLEGARRMYRLGEAYFVFRQGVEIGLGAASGVELKTVAAIAPGAGRDVVLALAAVLQGGQITLEVASANQKAMALYEGLGFQKAETVSTWYQIF